jgi:hypothetical protein
MCRFDGLNGPDRLHGLNTQWEHQVWSQFGQALLWKLSKKSYQPLPFHSLVNAREFPSNPRWPTSTWRVPDKFYSTVVLANNASSFPTHPWLPIHGLYVIHKLPHTASPSHPLLYLRFGINPKGVNKRYSTSKLPSWNRVFKLGLGFGISFEWTGGSLSYFGRHTDPARSLLGIPFC